MKGLTEPHSLNVCQFVLTLVIYSVTPFLNTESFLTDADFRTSSAISVLNEKGKVLENQLKHATEEILDSECKYYLSYDQNVNDDSCSELNKRLINFTLSNIHSQADGHLVVPLV